MSAEILPVSPIEHRLANEKVLPAVWKLMLLRWRITFNSFKHAKKVAKFFTILGMIGLVVFGGFIFAMSWLLLTFLRSPELKQYVGDITAFINTVPVLIFTGLFLGILLTSFGVLLQALYLSGDMDFLLSAPVPIRAVFITKLLQAVLPNFGLIALFGLPVLFGLGISGGYNILYYPLVLLMMVMLSLSAAGLAALLVMLVVRIFPARRVVEVLGFFGAIVSIICSQSGNMINYSRYNGNAPDITTDQMTSALGMLTRFNTPWIPLNWPGIGLVALGEGNWLPGLGLTLLSLGLTGGLFWVSLTTAERWYFSGWAGMQAIAQKKKPARRSRPAADSAPKDGRLPLVARIFPAPIRGLIWKDVLVLQRDLRNLSQLITPLIFGIIYGFMFLRSGGQPPAGRGEAPTWFMDSLRTLMSYGNIGLSLFVGWMLVQRLAGLGFSQEGKNYWMLKTAPIRARQLLVAKFIVTYVPAVGLSTVFLVLFSIFQKTALGNFIYSAFVMVGCLAGMAGIQLAFGAAGANFKWEDPRRMNAGNMGCLGTILTAIYVPVNLVIFLGPLFLAVLFNWPLFYAYLAGGVLGFGMSLACTILPPWLIEGRVERLGEG